MHTEYWLSITSWSFYIAGAFLDGFRQEEGFQTSHGILHCSFPTGCIIICHPTRHSQLSYPPPPPPPPKYVQSKVSLLPVSSALVFIKVYFSEKQLHPMADNPWIASNCQSYYGNVWQTVDCNASTGHEWCWLLTSGATKPRQFNSVPWHSCLIHRRGPPVLEHSWYSLDHQGVSVMEPPCQMVRVSLTLIAL